MICWSASKKDGIFPSSSLFLLTSSCSLATAGVHLGEVGVELEQPRPPGRVPPPQLNYSSLSLLITGNIVSSNDVSRAWKQIIFTNFLLTFSSVMALALDTDDADDTVTVSCGDLLQLSSSLSWADSLGIIDSLIYYPQLNRQHKIDPLSSGMGNLLIWHLARQYLNPYYPFEQSTPFQKRTWM